MVHPSRLSVAVAVAVAGAGSALPIAAQENQADIGVLQTLEITAPRGATKTETPFVETPQSISTITREQIEEQGARSVQEATRYSAGVFTNQYGATASRYDAIKLRGFGSDSTDNQYLDGLKVLNDKGTYSIMQIDPYFLESIEVVKGPSSVLYGRSAPGGLIAMTSKRPTFTPQYQVQASVGTQGHRSLGFDFSNEVGDSGNAAYRLVGRVKQSDTQWDYVEEERYALAPSLTVDLTDSTTLTLLAQLQKDPEGGYYGSLPAEGTLEPRNGRTIPNDFYEGEPSLEEFDREQMMLGYQLEHRFNDTWSARQNLRYMNTDVEYGQVYVSGGWVGNSNELARTFFGADETLDSFAVDNQLIAEFGIGGSRHRVLTGLDYQRVDTDAYWTAGYNPDFSSTIPPINAFDPQYGNTGTINPYQDNKRQLEQTGVYIQDQVALDQWRLTLSGRHDWVDVTNEYDTLLTGASGDEELDASKFSGRAGLLYLFDNGAAPYVSYSESFSPSSNVGEDGNLIEPTEGRQYEAGLKYEPAGTRDRYSAAIFRIDQDNVANYIRDIRAYRAVGSTRSEGLELEATTWLTPGWSVVASYTYTDVTVEESSAGNEGNTPVATPRHMASLWGSYEFRSAPLQGLDAALGLRYVGESWANEANTLEVPDYTLVDANLSYDLTTMGMKGVTASLNARNLFDKEYVGACYSESVCYYGAERSVEATLTYDF